MATMHTEEEVAEVVARVRDEKSVLLLSTELLASREAHWAERDAALNRLGELLQEGALDASADDFATSLKAAVNGLVLQLPDLRSQVVRSACNTLALLAAHKSQPGYRGALGGTFKEKLKDKVMHRMILHRQPENSREVGLKQD